MKTIKVTKPGKINMDYFLEHFEEILNNTDVLLNHDITHVLYGEEEDYADALRSKHYINWQIFRRHDFVNPGECVWEAYQRIDREYCEATGHWNLYEWEEITEEEYNKRVQEHSKLEKEWNENHGGYF